MRHAHAQRGSVLTEAAVGLSVVSLLALGLLEMARTAWTQHAALQATTEAARLAARCGHGPVQAARIRATLRPMLEASGQLRLGQREDWLLITPLPQGCDDSSCTHVQARLQGLQVELGAAQLGLTLAINPPLSTALREAWGQWSTGIPSCRS